MTRTVLGLLLMIFGAVAAPRTSVFAAPKEQQAPAAVVRVEAPAVSNIALVKEPNVVTPVVVEVNEVETKRVEETLVAVPAQTELEKSKENYEAAVGMVKKAIVFFKKAAHEQRFQYGFDFEALVAMIKFNEGNGRPGRPFWRYKDTKGYWTVGYGSNFDDPVIARYIPEDVKTGKRAIKEWEAEFILRKQLHDIFVPLAIKVIGEKDWWEPEMTPGARMVMVDMSLMGEGTFKNFEPTWERVRAAKYKEAAERIQKTPYAEQVGHRDNRNGVLLQNPETDPNQIDVDYIERLQTVTDQSMLVRTQEPAQHSGNISVAGDIHHAVPAGSLFKKLNKSAMGVPASLVPNSAKVLHFFEATLSAGRRRISRTQTHTAGTPSSPKGKILVKIAGLIAAMGVTLMIAYDVSAMTVVVYMLKIVTMLAVMSVFALPVIIYETIRQRQQKRYLDQLAQDAKRKTAASGDEVLKIRIDPSDMYEAQEAQKKAAARAAQKKAEEDKAMLVARSQRVGSVIRTSVSKQKDFAMLAWRNWVENDKAMLTSPDRSGKVGADYIREAIEALMADDDLRAAMIANDNNEFTPFWVDLAAQAQARIDLEKAQESAPAGNEMPIFVVPAVEGAPFMVPAVPATVPMTEKQAPVTPKDEPIHQDAAIPATPAVVSWTKPVNKGRGPRPSKNNNVPPQIIRFVQHKDSSNRDIVDIQRGPVDTKGKDHVRRSAFRRTHRRNWMTSGLSDIVAEADADSDDDQRCWVVRIGTSSVRVVKDAAMLTRSRALTRSVSTLSRIRALARRQANGLSARWQGAQGAPSQREKTEVVDVQVVPGIDTFAGLSPLSVNPARILGVGPETSEGVEKNDLAVRSVALPEVPEGQNRENSLMVDRRSFLKGSAIVLVGVLTGSMVRLVSAQQFKLPEGIKDPLPEIQAYFFYFDAFANIETRFSRSYFKSDDPVEACSFNTYDGALRAIGGEDRSRFSILATYGRNTSRAVDENSPQTIEYNFDPDRGVPNLIRILELKGSWWTNWDWTVHAGPNAWIGMAALQFCFETQELPPSQFLRFARARAKFLEALQDSDGGIRMGPKKQFHRTGDKTFWWKLKSVEHNESAVHFFDMLYQVTKEVSYKQTADRIYLWLAGMYDRKEHAFHRGAVYRNGVWEKDGHEVFATDTTSWAPMARILADEDPRHFGATKADRLQEMYLMMKTAESKTGVYRDGKLVGMSFCPQTQRRSVISIEWSSQFILRYLQLSKAFRAAGDQAKADECQRSYEALLGEVGAFFRKSGKAIVAPYAVYPDGTIAGGIDTGFDQKTSSAPIAAASCYYGFAVAGYDPLLFRGGRDSAMLSSSSPVPQFPGSPERKEKTGALGYWGAGARERDSRTNRTSKWHSKEMLSAGICSFFMAYYFAAIYHQPAQQATVHRYILFSLVGGWIGV
ncbi:MAG TPA: hypothetical protein VLL97_15090, partial [Acidobacteriota bacterium]|nr:hypothetical protein [Acidobacteriota bacterium]